MNKIFADWRNWALIIAVIAIISLIGAVNKAKTVDSSDPIVKIGKTRITEKEFIANMKRQVGDQALLALMQRTLLEEYAKKKGHEVTKADIEQLRTFHIMTSELYGMSLDDMLKQRGISPEKFDLSLRMDVLNIKLAVPKAEIEKVITQAAKEKALPFTYPERYKIRRFIFVDAKAAEEAAKHLKEGDEGIAEAAAMSADPMNAKNIITYVPQPNSQDPLMGMLNEMLKGLKPGDVSTPKALQGDKGPFAVVQLVEVIPEEVPTMENRYLPAGLVLLGQYQKEIMRLEADMMDSVEVFFYDKGNKDYPKAVSEFKSIKLSNPNLPTATQEGEQKKKNTVGVSGGKKDGGETKAEPQAAPATDAKQPGE